MIEIYYSIINIVDFLALSEPNDTTKASLYNVLDTLGGIYANGNGETLPEVLADIADANNASGATSWEELVGRFQDLHESGERY